MYIKIEKKNHCIITNSNKIYDRACMPNYEWPIGGSEQTSTFVQTIETKPYVAHTLNLQQSFHCI